MLLNSNHTSFKNSFNQNPPFSLQPICTKFVYPFRLFGYESIASNVQRLSCTKHLCQAKILISTFLFQKWILIDNTKVQCTSCRSYHSRTSGCPWLTSLIILMWFFLLGGHIVDEWKPGCVTHLVMDGLTFTIKVCSIVNSIRNTPTL